MSAIFARVAGDLSTNADECYTAGKRTGRIVGGGRVVYAIGRFLVFGNTAYLRQLLALIVRTAVESA